MPSVRGRKPELTEADHERLPELLLHGSDKLGYETPVWTCIQVAQLIAQEFAVEYHSGHLVDDSGRSAPQLPAAGGASARGE